jgi:hypothetical protein
MKASIASFREFTWRRHPRGYRLWDSDTRIVASMPKEETYKPFERNENLFGEFASIQKTPEALLDFITKYGPLTLEGQQEPGEDVAAALEAASAMAGVLQAVARPSLTQLPPQRRSVRLTLQITAAGGGRPVTTAVPDTLLDAIWLQLAEALSGDAQIRRCLQCNAWFAAGGNFGRRRETKFCSDEHRILYNSLKRSSGKTPGHVA